MELRITKHEGHTPGVCLVAFSHDGSLLASASADQTVTYPSTGLEVQKLFPMDYSATIQGVIEVPRESETKLKLFPHAAAQLCATFARLSWKSGIGNNLKYLASKLMHYFDRALLFNILR
jgi:WD40 repeat protein